MLAYSQLGVFSPITQINKLTQIDVSADFDSFTYSVLIDGVEMASGVSFNSNVPINTVRFMTNQLGEGNFSDRCFDNLVVGTP